MKSYFLGTVIDTKGVTVQDIQSFFQMRADLWLGKDNTKIIVTNPQPDTINFHLFRRYGDFYDPINHQDCIFSWDEQILLGNGYRVGTVADFLNHRGMYIIYNAKEDFFYDYKQYARKNHCTRIKALDFSQGPDSFIFSIQVYGKF